MVGCKPIYFPVDSTLLLNIRHDTCSSSAGFSIRLNFIFLSSKKAKRTREKQRAAASSSKRPPKMSAAATCRSRFSTAEADALASIATRTTRESTRIFVVAVRMRSHELDFFSRFCFCWGGGGGGGAQCAVFWIIIQQLNCSMGAMQNYVMLCDVRSWRASGVMFVLRSTFKQ